MARRLIRIAHSPDSDDAFMFYALKSGRVTSPKYAFEVERHDIEELNQAARDGIYDITAISIHAYAHVADRYALLSSGMSMAEKDYGPVVVAKPGGPNVLMSGCRDIQRTVPSSRPPDVLSSRHPNLPTIFSQVAIPGEYTTAALVLRLLQPAVRTIVLPFDQILAAVTAGRVEAGLLIHEGQLQYERDGLSCVLRLIEGWNDLVREGRRRDTPTPGHPDLPTILPLPLGGNAVKKALGCEVMSELSALAKESVLWAMKNRDEARDYARQFKHDLTAEEADRYLNWYANYRTVDVGEEGRLAIATLFKFAHKKGILSHAVAVEVV